MKRQASQYRKDVAKVSAALRENKDGSVTVLKPLVLQVPFRYQEKKFLDISDRVRVLGAYALIVDDKYFAVDSATAMFETSPTKIQEVSVDDEPFFELVYEKGDLLLVSNDVLIDKELVYPISTEFYSNGRLPWFYNPTELLAIYPNLEEFNGVNLATDMAAYGILLSMMLRDPNDINRPFRVGIKSKQDLQNKRPVIVGMNKVDLIVNGTLAKLSGPYLNANITGALNVESTELSEMEEMLRI